MHARGWRNAHLQIVGRDFLYPGMHCPGTLLKLQLSVFDFELPSLILLLLQFDEQLSRLVLRRDQGQRADNEDARQYGIELDHGATLSATRMTALRARGFAVTSSSLGKIGLPTSFMRGFGNSAARTGKRAGSAPGWDWVRMKFLTMRSSRE